MAPMAIVSVMIHWGLDASSDKLRLVARYSHCGRKGAVIQRPSWSVRHGATGSRFLPVRDCGTAISEIDPDRVLHDFGWKTIP
jgi:hypothetical protein